MKIQISTLCLVLISSYVFAGDLNKEIENRIPKTNQQELAKKTETKAGCVTKVLLHKAGFNEVMVNESKMRHPFVDGSKTITYSNRVDIQVLLKDNAGMICRGNTYVLTDFEGQLFTNYDGKIMTFYSNGKLICYDLNGKISRFQIDDSLELEKCNK